MMDFNLKSAHGDCNGHIKEDGAFRFNTELKIRKSLVCKLSSLTKLEM
jgi:hypothetical protein